MQKEKYADTEDEVFQRTSIISSARGRDEEQKKKKNKMKKNKDWSAYLI